MVSAREGEASRLDERVGRRRGGGAEVAPVFSDEVLAWIQSPPDVGFPPQDGDSAAERRRRAEALASLAGGRVPLEELRSGFIYRLHRASDDFAATEGLRAVEAALSLIPRAE